MNFSVSKLGQLRDEAKINIAPLTVLIGPNNTNKTWAAYTLYALAKTVSFPWLWYAFSPEPKAVRSMRFSAALKANIDATITHVHQFLLGTTQEPGKSTIEVERRKLIEGIEYPFKMSGDAAFIAKILGVQDAVVSGAECSIEFSELEFAGNYEKIGFTLERAPQFTQLVTTFHYIGDNNEKQRQWGYPTRLAAESLDATLRAIIESQLYLIVFHILGNIIAFPAERKALVSLFGASALSDPQRRELVLSRPIRDYAEFLTNYSFASARPGANKPCSESEILEKQILGVSVSFGDEKPSPRSVTFEVTPGVPIKIHAASSLVKSLAGLDIYLKGSESIIDDLLIIDEPEMNAHPRAQMEIIEFLAMLVNRGCRIVITTHSPYIVDHLRNLLVAARLPEQKKKEVANKFYLKDASAFLPADNVSAYLFGEDGRVTDILDKKESKIDWSTFGDVSDRVTNLYADLLEIQEQ